MAEDDEHTQAGEEEEEAAAHRNKVLLFFAISAIAAITASMGGREGLDPEVINEGGPEASVAKAEYLLRGHNRRFYELFRMTKTEFIALARWMRERGGLQDTRYQTVELKLMVFVWIIAFNETQRQAAHFFLMAQSTVSSIVNLMMPLFVKLHTEFVVQPDDDFVAPEIELIAGNQRFSGAIGAIDGTHIYAKVGVKEQNRWRNRKGFISQNVFAAVRFDGSFSYVLAGAEGSMQDSRLLRIALLNGFKIPPKRFYLADAGFNQQRGILIPFPTVRYHLSDWREAPGDKQPKTKKELYNLRHSMNRVLVEQAFGWLKRMAKLIRESAPEYPIEMQIDFVYAITGLYNFIHRQRHQLTKEGEEALTRLLAPARRRADLFCIDNPIAMRVQIANGSWKLWQQYKRRRLRG